MLRTVAGSRGPCAPPLVFFLGLAAGAWLMYGWALLSAKQLACDDTLGKVTLLLDGAAGAPAPALRVSRRDDDPRAEAATPLGGVRTQPAAERAPRGAGQRRAGEIVDGRCCASSARPVCCPGMDVMQTGGCGGGGGCSFGAPYYCCACICTSAPAGRQPLMACLLLRRAAARVRAVAASQTLPTAAQSPLRGALLLHGCSCNEPNPVILLRRTRRRCR